MNTEKTALVIVRSNKLPGPRINLQIEDEVISNKRTCKILGFLVSADGSQVGNFNATLQKAYLNFNTLCKLPRNVIPS